MVARSQNRLVKAKAVPSQILADPEEPDLAVPDPAVAGVVADQVAEERADEEDQAVAAAVVPKTEITAVTNRVGLAAKAETPSPLKSTIRN